jgi:hypothetical protein
MPCAREGPLSMPLSITWDPGRSLSPAANRFIELIYQATREDFPGRQFANTDDSTLSRASRKKRVN